MSTVTICENPLDSRRYVTTCDNPARCIMDYFEGGWPDNARIYREAVVVGNDITPHDEASLDAFRAMEGNFYVVVYPSDPITIAVIVAIVIGLAAIALTFIFRPSAGVKPNVQQSPNNQLTDRQNSARPNERIPDIVGEVRGTPDLIAQPWREFISNVERSISHMVIGRGDYTVRDVRDANTPILNIAGASVAIYAPFTSPNSIGGPSPKYQFGTPISQRVISTRKITGVNSQPMRASNNNFLSGDNNVRFMYPDQILVSADSAGVVPDLTAIFAPGDTVNVSNATAIPGTITSTYTLNGGYGVLAVSSNTLTLANPALVTPDWNRLNDSGNVGTVTSNAVIADLGVSWIGPFVMDVRDMNQVFNNFVAPNGLYKDNGSGVQYAFNVDLEVAIQAVDGNGNPQGGFFYDTVTMIGSHTQLDQRGVTLKSTLPLPGSCQIMARRVTPTDLTWTGTIVDLIEWRDCYAVSPVDQLDFGDVTMLQAVTYASGGQAAQQSSKLNMLVTRNIQRRQLVGGVLTYVPGTDNIGPTKDAGEILCALALDPQVGGRTISELDLDGIFGALDGAETYFGISAVRQFCHTFDDNNISFEETVTDIAAACFCNAYRTASKISLNLEKLTDTADLMFNHRNKIPGTETRTVTFGGASDSNDGIEFDYIEPNDPNNPDVDTTRTLYFPPDQSATNPKKITSIGVRNNVQATLAGWRLYNKLLYQNTAVEFEATEEADMLVNNRRILVADNTRPETQDGEIVAVDGLTLVLSQDVSVGVGAGSSVIQIEQNNGDTFVTSGDWADPTAMLIEDGTCSTSFGTIDLGGGEFETTHFKLANYRFTDNVIGVVQDHSLPLVTLRIAIKGFTNDPDSQWAIQVSTASGPKGMSWSSPANLTDDYTFLDFTGADLATFGLTLGNMIDPTFAIEVWAVSGIGSTLGAFMASVDYMYVNFSFMAASSSSSVIFLQHYDSTTEAITCVATAASNEVTLTHAPRLALVTDPENAAQTRYILVSSYDGNTNAFLVGEKTPANKLTYNVKATNYDTRYYSRDGDVINGLLTLTSGTYAGNGGYPGSGDGFMYIPVMGGGSVGISMGGPVASGTSITVPPAFGVGRAQVFPVVANGYSPTEQMGGVLSAYCDAAAKLTASFYERTGPGTPFLAESAYCIVAWTDNAAVTKTIEGNITTLTFTNAFGDDLAFVFAYGVQDGDEFTVPDGFDSTHMVTCAAPSGTDYNGNAMQGVRPCSISGTTVSVGYNDNQGDQFSGAANVFAFFYKPGANFTTESVAGGLATIMQLGTNKMAFVQANALPSLSSFALPTGFHDATYQTICGMCEFTDTGGDNVAHGWTHCETFEFVLTATYQDGELVTWPGKANVLAVAYLAGP